MEDWKFFFIVLQYTDSSVLVNPEKGFYSGYEIYFSNYQPISLSHLQQWWSTSKISLVHMNFVLDNCVTSNISSTILSKMTTDFQTLRTGGMKSVVRFSYSLTEGNMLDAVLSQLLKHIDQLKPFFQVGLIKLNEEAHPKFSFFFFNWQIFFSILGKQRCDCDRPSRFRRYMG